MTPVRLVAESPAGSPISFDLDQLIGGRRVAMVFAETDELSAVQLLLKDWRSHEAAVRDRDLILIQVYNSGTSFWDDNALPSKRAAAIFESFEPSRTDPTLILVGKDGREKARQIGQFDLKSLFDLIDTMPMRIREMQQGE